MTEAPRFGVPAPAPAPPRIQDWEETGRPTSTFGVSRFLQPDGPVASVLFVCTGNICRSPFAERLLSHQVPGLEVASFGTHAMVGSPMDALMAAELAARGGSASGFVSRQVPMEAPSADLILVMSDRQRRFLLEEHPGLVRRTGLLGAIESLAALVPTGEPLLRSHVAQWARLAHSPVSAEIEDPYRRGPEASARSAERIAAAVAQLAPALRGDS